MFGIALTRTVIDDAIDEWHGRLCACVWTLQATIVTVFSHMTRDVSVFVKYYTIYRLLFLEITTNSNFYLTQLGAATY